MSVRQASKVHWHLITGEYPPDPGGVSDYTWNVAETLAKRDEQVHVWAPGATPSVTTASSGAYVHRIVGRFGLRGLRTLGRELNLLTGARTIVLQYTPHAFGLKAMNLPLCMWLLCRRVRYDDDVRVMFHEAVFPFVRFPLHHNLLALVTRLMAFTLLRAAGCVYVSTPAWYPYLDACGGRRQSYQWLPVPANIPAEPQPTALTIRQQLVHGNSNATIVGHFGTYGGTLVSLLADAISRLLQTQPRCIVQLLGRGCALFRDRLLLTEPKWRDRLKAAEDLLASDVAAHMQACDLAVQPYPDGISTRRTSAMAWLANGVPLVSNLGRLSEDFWDKESFVLLARRPSGKELVARVTELLDDEPVRQQLGAHGRAVYERQFTVARVVDVIIAGKRG